MAYLAAVRPVEACDDLYEDADDFDAVYRGIADRVMMAATQGPITYAVPGHPAVAERAVGLIRERAGAAGVGVRLIASPSFLDAMLELLDIDPVDRGLELLDARRLPALLLLRHPTVIAQVDSQLVAGDLQERLLDLLEPGHGVTVVSDAGGPDACIAEVAIEELGSAAVGPRTSVFLGSSMYQMSRLVTIPSSLPSLSTTGNPATPRSCITLSRSTIVKSLLTVNGF